MAEHRHHSGRIRLPASCSALRRDESHSAPGFAFGSAVTPP